ncbi:MAG: hypothetical protein K9L56_14740 [Clostridiales bacterium]|nr:hypothetical protein [Clostridiales bacterium]
MDKMKEWVNEILPSVDESIQNAFCKGLLDLKKQASRFEQKEDELVFKFCNPITDFENIEVCHLYTGSTPLKMSLNAVWDNPTDGPVVVIKIKYNKED